MIAAPFFVLILVSGDSRLFLAVIELLQASLPSLSLRFDGP